MRIALITETWLPSVDGVVTRLRHTVGHLTAAGHEVLVLAPTNGPPLRDAGQFRLPGVSVPFIDRGRRVGLPLTRALSTAIGRFDPDIVHVVNPVLMGSVALGVLAAHYPAIASFHTDLEAYVSRYRLAMLRPALRTAMRQAYRRADLALATSPTGQQRLAAHGIRASIWPPAVDGDVFRPHPAIRPPEWLARDPELPVMICVGRLAPEKNLDLLAEVLAAANRARPRWQLTFIGDGPERTRLTRRCSGLPVTFAGRRTPGEVAEAYAAADAVIMPSVTETVGLVLLEAAACGAPIIAADNPANRHTVGDHPARFVAHDAPPERWVAALDDVSARPRPVSTPAPSWREVTAELIEAYRSVAYRRRPDRPRPVGSPVLVRSSRSAGRTARRSCAARS